jgi:hypothetical protein
MKQMYKYTTPSDVYNVWLEKQKYANGRVALVLMDAEGQVASATVNLPEHDIQANEVIIKTWSENATMLDFLIRNRICADTGREITTGFVKARVCKLLI